MTIDDKTKPEQGETLTLEFALRHTPAKVWRAITDPVLMNEWLLPSIGFSPEEGVRFTLQAPEFPGWDGTVNCKVLNVEPQSTLSYAWIVGDMVLDTVVTFTVVPTTSGTLLRVEQSGFKPDQKQNFGGARYGWRTMGEKLITLLAEIEVQQPVEGA